MDSSLSEPTTCDATVIGICFVRPPEGSDASIFGFAEFGTALALLVVLYTISAVRYRFRIAVAPIPLYGPTYVLLALIGALTLFSDIAFTERWPLPVFLVKDTLWQGTLGGIFLGLVLVWMFFAFMGPATFSRWNYRRFTQELFRYIFRGSGTELPAISAELARSAGSIVKHSRQGSQQRTNGNFGVNDYAYDLLLLIGNRKFCRHIVASSPGTAMAFFDAVADARKYRVPLGQFAKNISTEAIINKDSIIYHEDAGFNSGLIGYLKPFSESVYGNYSLVEALASSHGSPLDVHYQFVWAWDSEQLEAYSRAALTTLRSYLEEERWRQHSYAIKGALDNFETSIRDLYKIEGVQDYSNTEPVKRLEVTVHFIRDAIDLIGKQEVLPTTRMRTRGDNAWRSEDLYDRLVNLMYGVIMSATSITAPPDKCWTIQYNSVWSHFFGIWGRDNGAWKMVQFKLRRRIYDEIRRQEEYPNYVSTRLLGICLNVMGLGIRNKKGFDEEYYALRKAVLAWTESNFMRLVSVYPEGVNSCVMGGISFDKENARLTKTYVKSMGSEAAQEHLDLAFPEEAAMA